MKATAVKALQDYRIQLVFDDGVTGIVELHDLVQKGIFRQLKDETAFSKVYIHIIISLSTIIKIYNLL